MFTDDLLAIRQATCIYTFVREREKSTNHRKCRLETRGLKQDYLHQDEK